MNFENRFRLSEAGGRDIPTWDIPEWHRDVLIDRNHLSCPVRPSKAEMCIQRLSIMHQSLAVPIPVGLVEMFVVQNLWVADLEELSGYKESSSIHDGQHSCSKLYANWGVHHPTLTPINAWITEQNYASFSFASTLFPIEATIKRLSARYPDYIFRLSYAASYYGVCGTTVFQNGIVIGEEHATSIGLQDWLEAGGKASYFVDELSDPWEFFELVKPSNELLERLRAAGLRYSETEALSSMRIPAVRRHLLLSRQIRRGIPDSKKEIAALVLGVNLRISKDISLKLRRAKAVNSCRQKNCPWVVSGVRPDLTQNLTWDENHLIQLHAVNDIRHQDTNYDHIYRFLSSIGEESFITAAKIRVSLAITDRVPKTRNANREIIHGLRLHKD